MKTRKATAKLFALHANATTSAGFVFLKLHRDILDLTLENYASFTNVSNFRF